VEAVAERAISVEFVFDRSASQTLAQAYRILVPEPRARTSQKGENDDRRDTSTAAGEDHTAVGA
jgi:hypothetical protein